MVNYAVWLTTNLGEMDYFHFCDITLRPNCKWGRAYCCIFLLLWKYLAPPISVNGKGKAETMARLCLFLQISFSTQIVWYLPNESNLLEIFPLNKIIKCKNSVTQWLGLMLLWCSKQYIYIFIFFFREMLYFFQLESLCVRFQWNDSSLTSILHHSLCFFVFKNFAMDFGTMYFCEQSGFEQTIRVLGCL